MSRRMAVMCRAGLAASHSRKNVGRGPGPSQSTVRQRQSARCSRQAWGTDLTGDQDVGCPVAELGQLSLDGRAGYPSAQGGRGTRSDPHGPLTSEPTRGDVCH